MRTKPIVILTDFGTEDPFVGIMKGVISVISPGTPIIDLTHEIPPGDIRRANILLWQSFSYFPLGTIFLVVVDPGVGTQRNPIILETKGYTFVGPDNGVFTFIHDQDTQAWILENPDFLLPNLRMTFHGRDIFAPCAAYAARGIRGPEFGDRIMDIKKISSPRLDSKTPGRISGEILHPDRFGNILTSLGIFTPISHELYDFQPWSGDNDPSEINLVNALLQLPNQGKIKWASTFADIPENHCAIIVGSSGLLEIAANGQSAARLLCLDTGDPVDLYFQST
jgi:S-adenosylmethionine hydrolase